MLVTQSRIASLSASFRVFEAGFDRAQRWRRAASCGRRWLAWRLMSSLAHVNDTFHAVAGGHCGRCDTVLAGTGLGDDARLAHAFGQHGLADAVIHLVGTGVVEVFTLQVDLSAAEQVGPAFGVIDRRRVGRRNASARIRIRRGRPDRPARRHRRPSTHRARQTASQPRRRHHRGRNGPWRRGKLY